MFSPTHFKQAPLNKSENILQKFQQDLSEEERRSFIKSMSNDTELPELIEAVSLKWQAEVNELERELLIRDETTRMTIEIYKSRLKPDCYSNVDALGDLLEQFMSLHRAQEHTAEYEQLHQRVSDIFGDLSIKSLCSNVDKSILINKQMEEQQSRASLTLEMTNEVLYGSNETMTI